MNPTIKIANLSHAFAKRKVLKNLSFNVAGGDFFIIIGPNGSGKTTLMKLMAGIFRPQSGKIEVMERPIRSYTPKALARAVAFVPQRLPVEIPFTVGEAVLLGRAPYQGALGIEREVDLAIAKQAMQFTGVDHLTGAALDQLSGGEQQRVFIARAICQEPEIMLLDEPTASLDLAHQVRVMDLMEKLKVQKAITVIMVSHDVNLAAMYGDQVLLLKDGEIVCSGSPSDVLSFRKLEQTYGCRLLVDESPLGQFPRVTLVPGRYTE
ncbi:Vitamin B12 ABC transporter, ATP-binding protein BtuD [Olavius sp. associated proteobacterium Delta 1]|nr:Vitamin B12 ABC transporter, ATP-binding protein BtuD [Olavius sp. associated proteobacterium Delta 1]